jgi:hypothetical protein
MAFTMRQRIEEIIKSAYKSPPVGPELAQAAGEVMATCLAGQVTGEAAGAAADQAHPLKNIGFRDIVSHAVDAIGPQNIVGAIMRMPVEIGLLTPLRHYYNQTFQPEIPGPSDLIRFVVREVITPEEFYATMPLHGFSEKWAKAYWDSHWVLPAFGNVVDAYHRRILSQDELRKFMIWHDYSPEPRPGVSKSDVDIMMGLLKTPIPRVDLRRGWEMGAIPDEDLVRRFEALGYEDDSPLMASIAKQEAMEPYINRLIENARSDFVKGYIQERDFRATLEALGKSPSIVEFLVQDALQDRQRRLKDSAVSDLKDSYVKGAIADLEDLKSALSEYIVDPEALEAELRDAYVRRWKKPKEATAA